MTERISALKDIVSHYDVILCDVWGVLHNGVNAFAEASRALASVRQAGLTVILITNSPRPGDGVLHQLDVLGVSRDAYDGIVSSGDVTRKLIIDGPKKAFLLGPERDLPLIDGTGAELVDGADADIIVCTGFFDDETEQPEDYREMLQGFASRNLPMICANPDLIVERGERLIPCAGALAALYSQMGGETRIAGKPYRPIYDAALEEAEARRGPFSIARVLAVGDGMPTDVKGAIDRGLALLYISAGIHARDYMTGSATDVGALERFLAAHDASPRWWQPRLQ